MIPAGAFFGLLGPNGAGKTTLISAVCNLIRVTSGEVLVFGEPADTLLARSWIGLAEQDINLDRFLTVRETLTYHGGYFGMQRDEAEERAEEMIEAFGLEAKRDVRAPKLSGGQRRRLLLARALMHRPRLVILDEPTAGVDVELRAELWRYIDRLHAEGTTILLTTHYLEEAERLCEEIGLIRDGRLIARDSAEGLREHFGVDRLHDVYMKAMAAARRARDRPRLALPPRDAARLQALDSDGAGAGGLVAALHPGVRAVARRAHQAGGRRGLRGVHRARADHHGHGPGGLRQQRLHDLPGPLRPLHQRRPVRAHAPLADDARVHGGRHLPRARHRRLAARAVGAPRGRAGGTAVRPDRRRGPRPGPVRVARPGGGHLRRDLGPHHLHRQHRDPAAGLRGRRLLLRGRAARPLARAVAREPGLLPRERRALRLPRPVRRVRSGCPSP